MSLDGSYSGLKAAIADFLNRGDLTAAIPDFIALAEAQMARRFVGRAREGLPIPRRLVRRSDASIALSAEFLSVPADFMGAKVFELQTSPVTKLDFLEYESFQAEKARNCFTGKPRFYTVVGNEFQLFPVADAAYSAELTYILRIAALSSTNPANWILTDYPDAYLYGALVQSAPYLKDDARISTWAALFTAALDDICSADPVPSNKVKLRVDDLPTGLGRLASINRANP